MPALKNRLLGVWQSDRRKTIESNPAYKHMSLSQKRKFGKIFGHLQLKYTRKFCYNSHCPLDGTNHKQRYEVIAEDGSSLVVRTENRELKETADPIMIDILPEVFEPLLLQLHFVREAKVDYYWVAVGLMGYPCAVEWFRKVSRNEVFLRALVGRD